jgi:NADPH2:quinone reductase
MRAVVFENPSNGSELTSVRDLESPEPLPGEVLIEVECAGVNYVDVMARRGDQAYAPTWPFRPGLEVAGTVLAVGAEHSALAVGDRVAAFTGAGGLAERVVAKEALTVALPDQVPFTTAAAAPLMLSTAMLLLGVVARIARGESLLMHAAGGGLGGGLAQIARALGCRLLVGTVSSPDKEAAAKAAGWDHVLVRDSLLSTRLATLAPDGIDVLLDPLGTQMLDFDLDHAAVNGRVVLFGNPKGEVLGDLPPAGRLIGGNVSVGGFSISGLSRSAPHRVAKALRTILVMLADGDIDVPVTVVDGLDEVAEVHDALAHGTGTGKYVVQVGR